MNRLDCIDKTIIRSRNMRNKFKSIKRITKSKYFIKNRILKKMLVSKYRHEKNIISNQNKSIDFDTQSSKYKYVDSVILNNTSLFEYSKNFQNIIGVSHLASKSSIKENVLPFVSIDSTDISINKNTRAPNLSLANTQNDRNDNTNHSQLYMQHLNGIYNSNRVYPNNEAQQVNNVQLEKSVKSRSYVFNRIKQRMYTDNSHTIYLSQSSPVYDSAHGSTCDMNPIPSTDPEKNISISSSLTNVHDLNDSSHGILYHGKMIVKEKKQQLEVYSNLTDFFSKPLNLVTQLGVSKNLNEACVRKVFLGNKSPSQKYYCNPKANFHIPSSMDVTNHGIINNTKQSYLKNKQFDYVNTSQNYNFIHPVLQPTYHDLSLKHEFIEGEGEIKQNSPMVNNEQIYNFAGPCNNSSVVYEKPLQLQQANTDFSISINGLPCSSLGNISKSHFEEERFISNEKDKKPIINKGYLISQSSEMCKVYYKWPINKNRSQTNYSSNKNIQETSRNMDYEKNVSNSCKNIDYKSSNTQLLSVSLNTSSSQNFSLSLNERKNYSTSYPSNKQLQDITNFKKLDLSPAIQSGSHIIEEEKKTQSQKVNSFESYSPIETFDHQEINDHTESLCKKAKMLIQCHNTNKILSHEVFESACYLFNKGKLFLCRHSNCNKSHHFCVTPSNAESLRHVLTERYDDFRFNIQYRYKVLLTSNPRVWPNIPELVQLPKRCLCHVCCDTDSDLNKNQDMLKKYVKKEKPNIKEDNDGNEQQISQKIKQNWKKNLINSFKTEANIVTEQYISNLMKGMERHINHFTRAFTIIFALSNDVKINLQRLLNACESSSDINDS